MSRDAIQIHGLQVRAHIGVPDAERATEQELAINLVLEPSGGFTGLNDDIAATVDYHAVILRVEAIVGARPRRLVETLAVEIADCLLGEYPLGAVEVTVDKFILPQTRSVGVRVRRERV